MNLFQFAFVLSYTVAALVSDRQRITSRRPEALHLLARPARLARHGTSIGLLSLFTI